jgi:tetratricopeptide (TPR) repeat protein
MFRENTSKKQYPMIRQALLIAFLFISFFSIAQTDSLNYFLQKGLQEKQNGRRMESLKNFEKAIKYDANNKAVLTELASAYLDLRKYFQAIETYKKLVAAGDATTNNYKQLLILSFNTKQYDDAILFAKKLKQIEPSEKVSFYIGKINYERDNYGEAIQNLNAAAKEEPQNAEVPYMLGHSYADMQNYKQAVPFYQKAIELDTTKNSWIYELGLICYAMNDNKNSLKYILQAGNKGYPKSSDYLENLAIAYLNVGNLDEGLKIINDLLKKRPSDINLLNMIAEAFYYKGKYDDAMNYWDQILGYDKTNASALYMIGMCYQKKGDRTKGMQLCDKAIEMDPSLAIYKQKKEMAGL